ncbi:hypothetical protein BJV82DRAFT_596320, partial [Fennellomyces sp. T-0311]
MSGTFASTVLLVHGLAVFASTISSAFTLVCCLASTHSSKTAVFQRRTKGYFTCNYRSLYKGRPFRKECYINKRKIEDPLYTL